MPFTERDLRAMLEENSSTPPPAGDLAAAAERRGRRVRRRRQAAGSVAAAALVALGFTVAPSLLPDDGAGRNVVAAATDQVPAAGSRPDVDLGSLPREETPWSFFDGLGDFLATGSPAPAPSDVAVDTEDGEIVYRGAGPLSARSIVGTVEGFSSAPGPSARMKVRLDAQIDDPSRLEERGLREGEVVELWVGRVDAKGDPTASLRRAVPKGTRVVAFEHVLPPAPASSEKARRIRSVVFEDADGTPVAGPYFQGPPSGVWKEAKTFDAMLELVKKTVDQCAALDLADVGRPVPQEALEELDEKVSPDGSPMKEKCLRLRMSDPSAPAAPAAPALDPTVKPTPRPSEADPTAPPAEPMPSSGAPDPSAPAEADPTVSPAAP